MTQAWEGRVDALDLASDEKRLVDGVDLVVDDHGRRPDCGHRSKSAVATAGLGGAEQALAGVDHLLRAPPALLELERVRAVCRREVDPEQPGNRAAKAVDGLVGVTDNHEVRTRFGRGEQVEELKLRGIDVLELVHKDEPEFGTQLFTQLVLRLQQLDCADDQVAEVDHARAAEALLVGLICGREGAKSLAPSGLGRQHQGRRMDEVLLHQRHEPEEVACKRVRPPHSVEGAESIGIDLRQHLPHHKRFLEAVEEQPPRVGRVITQHSPAKAVECRDPRFPVVVFQPLVDAPRDLICGPRREREREDLVASGDTFEHGLLVEVDQRACLSRARPGEHSERALDVVDVDWQGVHLWLVGSWIMRGPWFSIQHRLLRRRRSRFDRTAI